MGNHVKSFAVGYSNSFSLTHQVGHLVMEGDEVPCVTIGGGGTEPQVPLLGRTLFLLTAGSRQWSQCPKSVSSTGKG